MGLVNQYMSNHERWRYEDYKQFEDFMEILFRFTVKAYSSNVVLTEAYIPISELEKQSASLFAKDLLATPSLSPVNSPKSVPKILTSVRSPTKDEYFKPHDTPLKSRRSLSYISAEESDKFVQGYNPSIFHMRVEISLNRTLLYVLSGLIEPVYVEVQELGSSFSGRMKEYSASYGSRWNEDLFRLMDCGLFGVHSYEKCLVNYKDLTLLLRRMNTMYGSVDASVKYGTLNHLHILSIDSLLDIIEAHMEMCFYCVILYLQGNEIRNKQFSISFTETKLKEKCGNVAVIVAGYLRRIVEQKAARGKSVARFRLDEEEERKQDFVEWLVGYFTTNVLSLIHICRCRRYAVCRSRWSPYH
eukprot:TRINITY_DN14569_c0_g2_i2.p1 TRINITY_DN14569_c0_g2~~TRINITY_DN14569_c0_g2_i2.p1  ORF type:complete len:358 (-),score=111.30 TRINITY_DN14569_c0_g2_i2:20-1093(-)